MATHPQVIACHHFGPFIWLKAHCGRCVGGHPFQPGITVVTLDALATAGAPGGQALLITAGHCRRIGHRSGERVGGNRRIRIPGGCDAANQTVRRGNWR